MAVLCVGNLLMRDDGLGPRVAAELTQRYQFPPNVEVLDRAVVGMQLLSDLKAFDVVVIVDAVDNTGAEPGSVLSFEADDLGLALSPVGAHDMRLSDVLGAAALLGYEPKTHCLGVQVADASPPQFTIGLSPAVEAALPLLMHSVLDLLAQHGVEIIDKAAQRRWDRESPPPGGK
jgi:hydrogenase maturation protease